MRLIFQAFATILLLSTLVGGQLMSSENLARAQAAADPSASAGTWNLAAYLWFGAMALSLAALVAVYLRQTMFARIVAGALGILLIVLPLVQPSGSGINDLQFTGGGIALFGVVGAAMLMLIHSWDKLRA